MKKILHILLMPIMAGSQKVSFEILKALPSDQYEKHVLFSSNLDNADKTFCINEFKRIGCKVILMESLQREIGIHDIKAIQSIYRLCKKEKYDIVHTNSTKPGIVGRIAAKIAGVPMIIHTVHGLSFHKLVKFPKWQFYWSCEMFAALFCDKITTVNNYYTKYFKWCKRKVSVIRNGADFCNYPGYPQINRVQNNTIIKLLFVGRLSEAKDPITMLAALNFALQYNNNLELTIVGDGELKDKCEQYVIAHNLQSNVIFTGWQNDIFRYYQTHDIFIMTSIYEAFGLVFLDAGYFKLPSVSTRVEGIPEVIENNVTGLLSNPKDIKAIASNILILAQNRNLRHKMGDDAHNVVIHKFNITESVKKYIALYQHQIPHSKG